jgi:hypothetical protein
MQAPVSVRVATSGYSKEMNIIGLFAAQGLRKSPGAKAKTSVLKKHFADWLVLNCPDYTINDKTFPLDLVRAGFRWIHSTTIDGEAGQSVILDAELVPREDWRMPLDDELGRCPTPENSSELKKEYRL